MAKTAGNSTNQIIEKRQVRVVEIKSEYYSKNRRYPRAHEVIEAVNLEGKWGKYTWDIYHRDILAIGSKSEYLTQLHQSFISEIAKTTIDGAVEFQQQALEDKDPDTFAKMSAVLNQVLNGRLGDASVVLLNSKLAQTEAKMADMQKELEDLRSKKK